MIKMLIPIETRFCSQFSIFLNRKCRIHQNLVLLKFTQTKSELRSEPKLKSSNSQSFSLENRTFFGTE